LQHWFDFTYCGSLLPADVEGNSQLGAQWLALACLAWNEISLSAFWRHGAAYYRRRQSNGAGRHAMRSAVIKRSIIVAGHKTSVSLEDGFWNALKEIAGGRDATLSDLVAIIDADRRHANLSSAIRLFVLGFYRDQVFAPEAEHWRQSGRERVLTHP
jgi:predicted DNA-binding ribbon-helix-helix protein